MLKITEFYGFKEVYLNLINIIQRMVKLNKKNSGPLENHIFSQILLYLLTIISALAQFKHALFFRKNEDNNIPS